VTLAFWILACLMIGVALAAVLQPLMRSRPAAPPSTPDLRLAAYGVRLAELQQEVAGGALSAEEAEAVQLETERELLRAIDLEGAPLADGAPRPARRTALGLLVLVPLASLALYAYLGRPSLLEARVNQHPDPATLEAVVERLAERLHDNPQDIDGWRLLARSYLALGRNGDAVATLEQVHESYGDNADILVDLAQTLAAVNGSRFAGRPALLLERALALNPQHPEALWLAGTAAMETGERDRAVGYWQTLIPLLDSAETAEQVRSLVGRVQNETPPAPEAAGPAFLVRVRVELAEEFSADDLTGATLFVAARASNGPAMPLAAVRLPAEGFPLDMVLDEGNLLTPTAQIKDFEGLDLSARISRSGQAERRSGDLIGEVPGVPAGVDSITTIVIDSRVP